MSEPKARRRLLNIGSTAYAANSSPATIRRWSKDHKTGFPEPRVINNRLFWFEDEVVEWLELRPRESEHPTVLRRGSAFLRTRRHP